MTEIELTTIATVDKQLDAYNNRDIDAFAATYHDDVEIHASLVAYNIKVKIS